MDKILLLLGFAFLLFLSALFSGLETAFSSARRSKLRKVYEKNEKYMKKVKRLEGLYKEGELVIGAILILNNIVNILISILAGALAIDAFGSIGIGIATFVVTFFILVFGEVIPKSIALRNEKLLVIFGDLLYIITTVLSPIVSLMLKLSNFIRKLTKQEKPSLKVSEDDIKALLEIGQEEGEITEDEKKLINNVFHFDECAVGKIKTPINKVVAIEKHHKIRDVREIITKTGFSKIPVYDNNISNIIGMIHAKDILKVGNENAPLTTILRPVIYTTEQDLADEVLKKMQKEGIHLAVVHNNKGDATGIVTVEDIMEELVGEIRDIHLKYKIMS